MTQGRCQPTRPQKGTANPANQKIFTPAILSEMIGAFRQRGFRINEIEMAAALGALIARGKAEILPTLRHLRRGAGTTADMRRREPPTLADVQALARRMR